MLISRWLIPLRRHRGIYWILNWCLFFTLSMTLAKLLDDRIGNIMILGVRNIISLTILIPMTFTMARSTFVIDSVVLLLMRIICMGGAIFLTFYSYRHLPLPIATAVGMSGPLITTALSILILGESLSRGKISALIIGYIGVIILASPDWHQINWVIMVALLANLLASFSILLTKSLVKTNHPFGLVFWGNFGHTIIYTGLLPFFWTDLTLREIGILCAIGVFGTISQFSYTKALSYENASFVAPFEYTRLLLAIPIGYLLFDNILTIKDIGAIFLIVVGTLALLRD